ncbi:MAG: pyridoxamine 5'-phosphate oxidase family protein [Methanomethylovorans sp.]|nr:pyridoxamine 5'-phosphate oxidase family protein [Methanomethylovorans sp.]
MQNRMKDHQLNDEKTKSILIKVPVGNIATINENGYPYVVPVHFTYMRTRSTFTVCQWDRRSVISCQMKKYASRSMK